MLLQVRKDGRGLNDGQVDSSASGHVDPGEDYTQTALRETSEELGIKITADDLQEIAYFKTDAIDGEKKLNRFTKVFLVELGDRAVNVCIQPDELESAEWWSEKQIEDALRTNPKQFVPGFRVAWCVSHSLAIPEELKEEYDGLTLL
jgi:8-oxo-dGTP pyrophosphatase MutT (NUDIX family)